jgi:hypothetical protein
MGLKRWRAVLMFYPALATAAIWHIVKVHRKDENKQLLKSGKK